MPNQVRHHESAATQRDLIWQGTAVQPIKYMQEHILEGLLTQTYFCCSPRDCCETTAVADDLYQAVNDNYYQCRCEGQQAFLLMINNGSLNARTLLCLCQNVGGYKQ